LKFVIKGKKIGKDMQRWSQQKQILEDELQMEEAQRREYEEKRDEQRKRSLVLIDFVHYACLLCQRKFRNENHLRRHMQESELHKNNQSLGYDEQLARIEESCSRANIPLPHTMQMQMDDARRSKSRKRFAILCYVSYC
jgi:hypothetical protein